MDRSIPGGHPVGKSVAAYGEIDIERLLNNPGIITNAQVFLALDVPLENILKHHGSTSFHSLDETAPTFTPAAVEPSRELKKRGFNHMGPTTAFSLLQATGTIPIREQYDMT